MSEYIKYQHVEKLGSDEVDGILFGECYVFPKLDGTNAQVWAEDGVIKCGSRNRELTLDNDNAGFMEFVLTNPSLCELVLDHEGCRFYGEWLVPHSLKTYRDDAWRQFYIFDIVDSEGKHLSYEECYKIVGTSLNIIAPIRIIKNPQVADIERILDENKYLIKDGAGSGEGVVIKNYSFVNKYQRTCWAKMVTNEFKEKHIKEMGAPNTTGTEYVEDKIIDAFLTESMIDKTYAKIALDGWNSKKIPQLIGMCWHDLVTECTWDIIKKHKNPTIDFRVLNRFMINKIKQVKPELF